MTTAVHADEEVIWATSTTGDDFQCVHVADWLKARDRNAELEATLARTYALIIAANDETDPVEINGRLVEMAETIRGVTSK